MLAAAQCGVRAPLSPLTQTTLEKHLPGLPKRRFLQQNQVQKCDVGCITDLCSSENLPEVEIFSLLEEQIPKYKLRADILTQFGGYENQDWFVPSPALQIPKEGLGLNKDQIRETLNYFLLCGNRVSQMTRAYDDIEAVTRLLEEKEKDLELTVQIGKELLTQNTRLENRVSELEGDLKSANENLSQLSYDLHTKSVLLAALTNDEDTSSEVSTPVLPKSFNLDLLQKKIYTLEDENKSLRAEATQLARDTDEVEEQERKLMADITSQLNSATYQYDGLNLELERYREENKMQHEQIMHLTAKLTEAEIRLHQLTSENEEQTSRLSITEENQNLLAGELAEFKARYQEVLSLLQETQEQLRNQRKRGQPTVRTSNLLPGVGIGGGGSFLGGGGSGSNGCLQIDSLQSELMETSLFSDNSLDSGIASDRGGLGMMGGMGIMNHPGTSGGGNRSGLSGRSSNASGNGYQKVFDTVHCAIKSGNYSDGLSQIGAMSMSTSSQPRMSVYAGMSNSGGGVGGAGSQTRGSGGYSSSVYSNSTYPSSMGAKSYSRESLLSDSDDNYPAKLPTGCPGAPGAKDLEAALKRLTPAQVLARRSMLSNAPPGTYNYDEAPCAAGGGGGRIPMGIRTPDSIMSTGSSGLSGISSSSNNWRLPGKLQIVKPMEGSQTLHHWNRLATPTLSGLLDDRPGVTIRGGRGLDELGLQIYSLSDVEEDADDNPGKQFQTFGSVYTYTTSTVMHPDDGLSVTSSVPQSQMSSRVTSVSSSRQPSAPSTPRHGMSRRNSCSTFSVNLGLASMLNERGIKGVTPSAINTPAGPNYSPTVTPCNSPDGSPTRDRSPEPALFAGLLSTGADMLRRKIVGTTSSGVTNAATGNNNTAAAILDRQSRMSARNQILLSRQEKRALRSLRLLEKVESLGLENIGIGASASSSSSSVCSGTSNLALQASPGFSGVRSRTASPMEQLTSLKPGVRYGRDDKKRSSSKVRSSVEDLYGDNLYGIVGGGSGGGGASGGSDSECSTTSSVEQNHFNYSTGRNNIKTDSTKKCDKSTEKTSSSSSAAAAAASPLQSADHNNERPQSDISRLKQMQRQRSRRGLINGQRADLGTVPGKIRPDLGRVVGARLTTKQKAPSASPQQQQQQQQQQHTKNNESTEAPPLTYQQTMTQSFVGTISSLFFGRKGGLL